LIEVIHGRLQYLHAFVSMIGLDLLRCCEHPRVAGLDRDLHIEQMDIERTPGLVQISVSIALGSAGHGDDSSYDTLRI